MSQATIPTTVDRGRGLTISRSGHRPGPSGVRRPLGYAPARQAAACGMRRLMEYAPPYQVKPQPPQPPRSARVSCRSNWPRALDLPPRLTGLTAGIRPVQAGGGASTACPSGKWDHRTRGRSQPRCSCVLPRIRKSRLAAEVSVGSASCADLCVRGRPVGVGNVAGCGHARAQSRLVAKRPSSARAGGGHGWPRQRPSSAAGSVSSTSQWIRRPVAGVALPVPTGRYHCDFPYRWLESAHCRVEHTPARDLSDELGRRGQG
jgi:hypothetical protein